MNNPSVNIWKKHYETMANGQGKNKQKQSNTRRGLTKTYRVKGLQTGSGNKKPSIEVVIPDVSVVFENVVPSVLIINEMISIAASDEVALRLSPS